MKIFTLIIDPDKLQYHIFRDCYNQSLSSMKTPLLVLLCLQLYLISSKAFAQTSPPAVNFALETNTLSWLSGHGGPDLKFIIEKGRYQWYAGLKVPFYSPYPIIGMPEDDLLFHRQRFAYGIDNTIGFRATFGSFQIGPYMQYGRFVYNNSRLFCVNGTSAAGQNSFHESDYTVCESVGVNNFREVTGRFGTGLETLVRIFRKGNLSMNFGTSVQVNFIATHYKGFISNRDDGINGVHDSRPEIHSTFNRMMLEDIPMYHRPGRSPSFDKVRIAQRILINFRYIL